MRTTLDLPEELINEALKITKSKTKTDAIIIALESLIKNEKIKRIKEYTGKINLEIDLDSLRQR